MARPFGLRRPDASNLVPKPPYFGTAPGAHGGAFHLSERPTMSDHPDDTLTVTLRLSHAAARQLVDQLLPPDPTLETDLRAIREKYLARTPAGDAPEQPTAA